MKLLANILSSLVIILLLFLFWFIKSRFALGDKTFGCLKQDLNIVGSKVDRKIERDYCEEKRTEFQKLHTTISERLASMETTQNFILEEVRKINNKGD